MGVTFGSEEISKENLVQREKELLKVVGIEQESYEFLEPSCDDEGNYLRVFHI